MTKFYSITCKFDKVVPY